MFGFWGLNCKLFTAVNYDRKHFYCLGAKQYPFDKLKHILIRGLCYKLFTAVINSVL